MAKDSQVLGQNVNYTISPDGILTLTVDLKVRNGISASGKNASVATSGGNQTVIYNNGLYKVGVNVYTNK